MCKIGMSNLQHIYGVIMSGMRNNYTPTVLSFCKLCKPLHFQNVKHAIRDKRGNLHYPHINKL